MRKGNHVAREYTKNEFCKSKMCEVLNQPKEVRICKTHCPYSAYAFLDWLIKNNFALVTVETIK